MPNVRYSPAQKQFLKQHYHQLSNAELARALGITCLRKVLELARRMGVKWRAENGAPQWRNLPASAAQFLAPTRVRRVAHP
jgi:hypothetical protein